MLGSTLELPSDSEYLGVKEGATGEDGHNIASPIDSRSLSPIPADGTLGGRKRPLQAIDSLPDGGHEPVDPHLHQGRSLPEKRGRRPRARRQEANEVGLVWRTVDPSLLDDTTLTGDTTLSLAQVVLCLRRMLTMVPSRHAHDAANSLPWHTDWLSSAELGFPLVADQFHRDAHPLITQYICTQIRAGDLTLGPLLRFRGGIGNDHCEICDQSTCRGSLIMRSMRMRIP